LNPIKTETPLRRKNFMVPCESVLSRFYCIPFYEAYVDHRRLSLAWFGLSEVHQDAFDRTTRALVVGQHPVDGLGPIEADACWMIRVDGTGSPAVAAGQHADPMHFAVTAERRVKLVGCDRLVQSVDSQQICRTGIDVIGYDWDACRRFVFEHRFL